METRRLANEVIQGLSTKAEKIRALAQAGYQRTEIADLMGIRYQHVRNVLVRSGIADVGMRAQRAITEEKTLVCKTTNSQQSRNSDLLLRTGFSLLGEWGLDPTGTLELDAKASHDPGVYAFVVDGHVVYVGLTKRGLRTRFEQYRRGHIRQRTSARIKSLIINTLMSGKRVQIIYAIPPNLEWNTLPVNTAAGLEAGIIKMFKPDWNMMGVL